EILSVDRHFGAGPSAEHHRIARLDAERVELADIVAQPRSDGDDLALLRSLLGIVGDDDPTPGCDVAFGAPDDDAIVEWSQFHWVLSAAGAYGDHVWAYGASGTRMLGGPELFLRPNQIFLK